MNATVTPPAMSETRDGGEHTCPVPAAWPQAPGSYFKGAYFKGAYFKGAYLKDACFKGAYFKGAYLKGACPAPARCPPGACPVPARCLPHCAVDL